MIITSTNRGTAAVISPRGEIDFSTLPEVIAAAAELPLSVTEVTWDLREAQFMDVAGLHLLVHQQLACRKAKRKLTVVGLQQQPLRLLAVAQDVFPGHPWGDLLQRDLPIVAA
ncbi:STAS domain-containing protein [Streptomyces sp. V4-01]|uniref:STAS domain-containing protein n=1 Tax=Actinacidiphila polyblastidii TaxID=3110430 RepID=A0ABU7PCD6_9ACTN|nr:STAS domain-containing protein [Streptomyces sp. V4-01]